MGRICLGLPELPGDLERAMIFNLLNYTYTDKKGKKVKDKGGWKFAREIKTSDKALTPEIESNKLPPGHKDYRHPLKFTSGRENFSNSLNKLISWGLVEIAYQGFPDSRKKTKTRYLEIWRLKRDAAILNQIVTWASRWALPLLFDKDDKLNPNPNFRGAFYYLDRLEKSDYYQDLFNEYKKITKKELSRIDKMLKLKALEAYYIHKLSAQEMLITLRSYGIKPQAVSLISLNQVQQKLKEALDEAGG